MNVQINYVAVVLAMVSSMVVGSIWYAKAVFGKSWSKLVGVNLDDEKKMKKEAPKAIAITIAVSLVTAYVLAHVIFLSHSFFNNSFLMDALTTAFWLWLGLTAARFITHDAFEQRPAKLTAMNCAHEFVTLMVMAAVIGMFGV